MEPSAEEKPDSYFDIVVVGACFCDLLTYIPCYPKPGETVRGDKFLFDFGGKGANMCIIAAKLGGQNAMIAMVGDDAFGRETIRNFKKFAVNTDWVYTSNEAATGITNSSKGCPWGRAWGCLGWSLFRSGVGVEIIHLKIKITIGHKITFKVK